jgi:hypothetical protein
MVKRIIVDVVALAMTDIGAVVMTDMERSPPLK